MPLYSMKCQVCEATCTTKLTFAEYDEVKAGTRTLTCGIPDCGGWAAIEFNPGDVNFVLKDGEHGGWISKAGKENAYRKKHTRAVERRQRDQAPRTTLQPNFGGKLTGSWKDARDAAYDSTLERVKQETDRQTAQQAAAEAAKTYDPLINREVAR